MGAAIALLMGLSRRTAGSIWGDGFDFDGFEHLAKNQDWLLCSDDELIFLFPRLITTASAPSKRIIEMLRARISRLERESAALDGEPHAPVLWTRWHDSLEACLSALWPRRYRAKHFLRDPSAGLQLCKTILASLETNTAYTFDEESSASFAFFSGIHPGYVGPSSPACYERDTVAGWMGYVFHGRAALLPSMLADYLVDMTVAGSGVMLDPVLAGFAPSGFNWDAIRRAAMKRLTGSDVVVRLPEVSHLTSARDC